MKPQKDLKQKAISLRKSGKTYSEIIQRLNFIVPKSTLSGWFKNIKLSETQNKRIKEKILKGWAKARRVAIETNKIKRERYLKGVEERILHLTDKLKNKDTAKIALAMLYLGEGSKDPRRGLMFGNSNPTVIKLFLKLLRYCYKIDENKFRCTVQCRADQNTKALEIFWSKITKISPAKFYKTQIDYRTVGKPSKKVEYKGVCRINYFSNDIAYELKDIIEVIK